MAKRKNSGATKASLPAIRAANAASTLGGEPESLGFALRLESGRALLDLRDRQLGEGIALNRLEMEIPNVKFPFDVTGGAERFHSTRCALRSLVLELSFDTLRAQLERQSVREAGFFELEATPEQGALTVTGVYGPDRHKSLFSFSIAPVIMAPRELALLPFDERIYGRSNLPAARVPWLLLQALGSLQLKLNEPVFDVVSMSVRELLPRFGWKIPDTSDVGLIQAEVGKNSWIIACGRSLLDDAKTSSRVSFAVEARAPFEDLERLVYANDDTAAFDAYRRYVDEEVPQRFAVRRYLHLAAADEKRYEEGRSVAEEALVHDERNSDALLFLAQYALHENDGATAAKYFARAAEVLWAEKAERAATLSDVTAARISKRFDSDFARQSLARALKRRKSDVRALRELFAIERQSGEWKSAALAGERLLRALAVDSRFPIHLEVGELLLPHDLKKAKLHAERALRAQMDDPDAIHLVAKVFARSGDVPRAIRYLSRLSERYIALAETEKAIAVEVEIAEHMERTRGEDGYDPRALLGRYQRILTLDSGLRSAIRRTAQIAFELGETSAARRWFEELIDDTDPDLRAEAAFRLGQIALEEQRELDAEASFQSSVSGPFAEEAYAALKQIYEARDDRRSLYRLEKQLASRSKTDAEMLEHHIRAASLARDEGMGNAVIEHLEAAHELAPAHLVVKRKLIDAVRSYRGPEILEALLAGLAPREHEPSFRAEWYLELATLRENKNELQGAKAALDAAIASDPTSTEANEALYSLSQKLNEPYGAFAALGNLARYRNATDESKAEIRINQAELLAGPLKRRDEARAYLLRALIDVPHHIRGLRLLGELAEEAKDWAMATDAWTRYLETGAEDGRAPALESLARLARQRGDLQEQLGHLFQLWQLSQNPDIFEDIKRVLKERGDFQRLVILLRDAARSKNAEEAAALRFETALVLRDSVGDWAAARAELEPLLDQPDAWGARAREMLVSLALDEGRQDLLAQAIERQISFASSDEVAALKMQLARAYREAHDDEAAVEVYRWLLEHDARNDEALAFLGEHAERSGNAELAFEHQLMRFRSGNDEALPALVRVIEQVPSAVLIASIPRLDKVPARFALEIAGRLDAEGYSEDAISALHRSLEGLADAQARAEIVSVIARIEESSLRSPQAALATLKREQESHPGDTRWKEEIDALIDRAGTPLQKGERQLERAYESGDVALMWQAFEALIDVAPEHAKLSDVFDKVALQPALRSRVVAFLERDRARAVVGERQRANVMLLLHEQQPLEGGALIVLARLLRSLEDGARAQVLFRELFEREPENGAVFQEWRDGAKDDTERDQIDSRRIEVLARIYKSRDAFSDLATLLEGGVVRGLVPSKMLAQARDLYARAGEVRAALATARKLCESNEAAAEDWLRRAELALEASEITEVVNSVTKAGASGETLRRFSHALLEAGAEDGARALAHAAAAAEPADLESYSLLATLLADRPKDLLAAAQARAEASVDAQRVPALREWLRAAQQANDAEAQLTAYRALADMDSVEPSDIDAALGLVRERPERVSELWEWAEPLVQDLPLSLRRQMADLARAAENDDVRAALIASASVEERDDEESEYLARRLAREGDAESALDALRALPFERVLRAEALRELWLSLAETLHDRDAQLRMREALASGPDVSLPVRLDWVEALLASQLDARAFSVLEDLTRDPAFDEDPRSGQLRTRFWQMLYDNANALLASDPARALAYSRRLLAEAPSSEEAWLLSVDAARSARDDIRLIELLSARPLSCSLAAELAEAYERTGDLPHAAEAYFQAHGLEPHKEWLDAALDALARSGDDVGLAQALVRHALGAADEAAMLERALLLYRHIGDHAHVEQLAQRLFERDPTNTAAYERYEAIVRAKEDALELSRLWQRRARGASPEEREPLALALARLHIEKLFEHDVAEQLLGEIYPDERQRNEVLYGLYSELQDEMRAAQLARRLFDASPKDVMAFERLRAHVERGGSPIELFELLEQHADALSEGARTSVCMEAAHVAIERLHDTEAAERLLRKAFSDERTFLERAIELYHAHGFSVEETALTKRLFALDPSNDEIYQRHRIDVETAGDTSELISLIEQRALALPEDQRGSLAIEAARLALDKAKDAQRAGAILEAAFGPEPRDRTVLNLKIAVHLRLGNDAAAMALLEGLALNTENPSDKASALLQASRIAERVGLRQKAASTWAQAMLAKPSPDEVARRDLFFPDLTSELRAQTSVAFLPLVTEAEQHELEDELCVYYEAAGELGQALELAERALARDPERTELRLRVGRLLEKLGQTESLVKLLSEQHAASLDRAERYRLAMQIAARCEQDLHDLDQALHFYRQAAKDDPSAAEPLEALVRIYGAQNKHGERCEVAEQLAELMPPGDERGKLCLQLGEWRAERQELDKASLAYLHAFSEGVSTPAARRSVRALTKRGQLVEEAVQALMRLGESAEGSERVEALKDAAEITAEARHDYVTAAELYRRALALGQSTRDERLRLVEWLERSGQTVEALNEILAQADKEERDDNRALLMRRAAALAESSGNEDARLLVLERKLARGKASIDEQLAFAENLQKAGRNDEAMRVFDEALAHAPNKEASARIKAKLVALGLTEVVVRSLLAVRGPERGHAVGEAAKLYEAAGDVARAYAVYRDAMNAQVELSSADLARIAVLAEQQGDEELLGEAYLRIAESNADQATRAGAYFSMAKLWLSRLSDATRAEDALKLSLKADPHHEGAQRMLARMLVEQNRLDEAKPYLQALEPATDEADALWMVKAAQALVELGEGDKARALLAPLAAKDDTAFWTSFEVESRAQNHQAAVRMLVDRLDARLPVSDPAVLERGAEHARSGNVPAAEERLLAALSDYGAADAKSYARLAELALARNDNDAALAWTLRRTDKVEAPAERAQALYEAGRLARKLGRMDEAQKELEAAFDLQPESMPTLLELFELYRASADAERLLMVGERMVIVDPNRRRPQSFYLALAEAAEATRTEWTRVLELYQMAAAVEPLSAQALEKAIVAAEHAGRDAERLEWEEERLAHVQATEDDYLRLGVIARDRLADAARAERYFRLAKSTNPAATAPVYALAAILAPNRDKTTEAIQLYRDLVARQPVDPEPYRLLARLYGQQQDVDRTMLYYDALRALDPSDEEAERFMAAAQQVLPELPPRGLGKNELGLIADAGLLSGLQQFFGPIAAQAELLYATDLGKLGLSDADQVRAEDGMGQRLFALMHRMGGRALEVTSYHARVPGKDAIVEPGAPAKLVLSADIFDLPARGVQFVICRALAFLSLGHLLPSRLPARDLVTLMGLMAKRFVPSLEVGGVPDDRAAFVVDRFRAMTPDDPWLAHTEAARNFAETLYAHEDTLLEHIDAWVKSGERTADRWALLMAGDLNQAFAYQRHKGDRRTAALPARGPQRLQAIAAREDLLDLMSFAVSDTYLSVRQALGVTLRR